MTAASLSATSRECCRHSIIGEFAIPYAVKHVGLLDTNTAISYGQSVSAFHMSGPHTHLELPGKMNAHVIAWFANMTEESHRRILLWIEEMKTLSRHGIIRYTAVPASELCFDQVNGRMIERKFSCAGFILCCFEESGIVRLIVPETELPRVAKDVLEEIWGKAVVARGRQHGIRGSGPWKVLLPSYLFHALSRPMEDLPHRPTLPDPTFA